MNGEMGSRVIKEISKVRMEKELKNIEEVNLPESDKKELRKKVKDKLSKTEISKLRMEVKIVMWKFYSENKSLLSEYVRDFREEIIVELMKGESVEDVFDSYGGVTAPSSQLSGVAA